MCRKEKSMIKYYISSVLAAEWRITMIKTTVGIDGMMCGMCESHVNDAIRNAFTVKKVSANHSKKKAEIISEEALDEEKLRAVIDETGYTVLDVTSEPYEKKGFSLFKK